MTDAQRHRAESRSPVHRQRDRQPNLQSQISDSNDLNQGMDRNTIAHVCGTNGHPLQLRAPDIRGSQPLQTNVTRYL